MRLASFAFIAALLAMVPAAAQDTVVEAAHVAVYDAHTTVTFDLSQHVEPLNIFSLSAEAGRPYRVVIDLPEITWDVAGGTTLAGEGLVQQVRYGRNRPGRSRIVLDLVAPAVIATHDVTRARGDTPAQLYMSLTVADAAEANAQAGFPEPTEMAAETSEPESSETYNSIEQILASLGGNGGQASTEATEEAEPATRARPIIVIDPGHGGRDPGMIAINGRQEKEIVLDVGRAIRDALNETDRFEVHMTRNEDVFLQLNQRYGIAQAMQADLFISIHVDSNDDHRARGATIYTLSERASDEEAARVAARENQSDAVAGFEVDEELTRILIDLAQRETMNLSAELAEIVVDSFSANGVGTVGRPHRFAGFRVLTAPDVPSILIEAGFGTNRRDLALLETEAYHEALGRSVSEALIVYFGLDGEGGERLAQREAAGN